MKAKIIWFNNLKGYGEAETIDGQSVFIHYTAFRKKKEKKVILNEGQNIRCEITAVKDSCSLYKKGSLIATKAKVV